MGAGIDYGMGRSNINHETGIRYGVIAQNTVGQAWYDDAEADYGEPTCPKCGDVAANSADLPEESEKWDIAEHACSDYGCIHCEYVFDSQDAFGDEPQGFTYSADGYELTTCLDVNVFVLASLFYTLAPFCSPCVPGAGDLDNACADGVKTYCLGHDWFEGGKAPYPVFNVETGAEVLPS